MLCYRTFSVVYISLIDFMFRREAASELRTEAEGKGDGETEEDLLEEKASI